MSPPLPHPFLIEPLLRSWLAEDLGRGDRTTIGVLPDRTLSGQAYWVSKADGVIAGLPLALQVFQLLDPSIQRQSVQGQLLYPEGAFCPKGMKLLQLEGDLGSLLMGERVALNLVMRLSGIATLTRQYSDRIADLPTRLVDTRKTTPGLRLLEKYASQVGGAQNHRMGLDDAIMIKDNHIAAAGSIAAAIAAVRSTMPYPLSIEVETEDLNQVKAALAEQVDIIMLDNMPLPEMTQAVKLIRETQPRTKIEASGNITLDRIRAVAETGVDYISTSATITQAPWLDLSMRII